MAVDSNPVVDGETIQIEQPWAIEREVEAYQRMEEELIREHDGEWVALFRGQALGFGATPREAVLAANQGTDRQVRTVLHRVGEPVGVREAPPSFRVDTPRRPVDRE
ncbi:MAG: hypothetical protein GF393_12325 [Armatimonadia bacterium]|nr:hypothetical protein [Armatimonadia bacterium]